MEITHSGVAVAYHSQRLQATNTVADSLSRRAYDSSNYSISPAYLSRITSKWGTPSIDLFSNGTNAVTRKFVSLTPHPRAIQPAGSDAFGLDWSSYPRPFLHPPIGLIGRVLQKVIAERVTGILVVPRWTSQAWWPTLLRHSQGELRFPPGLHFSAPQDHPFHLGVPWSLSVHLVGPAPATSAPSRKPWPQATHIGVRSASSRN